MTPIEIKERLNALTKSIGPKAYASITIPTQRFSRKTAIATVYPMGLGAYGQEVEGEGDTFEEALDTLEAKWVEKSDLHRANVVEKMALEIIRQTDIFGECTDAALRLQFSEDVECYGEEAAARACQMADRGPFTIRFIAGSNATTSEAA